MAELCAACDKRKIYLMCGSLPIKTSWTAIHKAIIDTLSGDLFSASAYLTDSSIYIKNIYFF